MCLCYQKFQDAAAVVANKLQPRFYSLSELFAVTNPQVFDRTCNSKIKNKETLYICLFLLYCFKDSWPACP